MADAYIFCIIICKLGYWQESCSITLFEANDSLEVGFYCAILTFDLAVSLKIKNGREVMFDFEEMIKR